MKATVHLVPVLLLTTASLSALDTQKERDSLTFQLSKSGHPRLLLDRQKVLSLRTEILNTRRFLWERYQQDIPRMVGIAEGSIKLDDIRYEGDLVPDLAFAWLMTSNQDLLREAKRQLLKLTSESQWDSEESLAYLVPGHFLFGIALGYDWLFFELTPKEKSQVASRLGKEAERQYQAITSGRIWWRNQYFQNHSHSNTCGLAFAAAALYGEDDRAESWMRVCDDFFQKVFENLPKDGGSLEGYAYAGYGGEYLLKYAMLAKELLGKDYTGCLWMQNFATYLLHGLLPYRTAKEWAMTFGDAPRRGWTSTAQHLFLLARLYRDPAAQWMGNTVIGLSQKGLGSHGWMMLIYYDPTLKTADPAEFPTFMHFSEIDQVMMRSSWTDPEAMLVGFKCGPFMGKTLSRSAPFDYGTGHQGPDAGAFQIFVNRQFLAIDPLYPGYKLTENYNTMLFKGVGQLGEQTAFGSAEALHFRHYPEIIQTQSKAAYDYVAADVTRAYHPSLGLRWFRRHLLFVKPSVLLVADEISLDNKGMVYNYAAEVLQTSGGLKHGSNDYVIGAEGDAFLFFAGVPGPYQLMAVYLDNAPGVGKYSMVVDGKTIHSWTSRNEDTDDHLLAVSPTVELKPGSRIAFHAEPMAAGCRLVKMTAFSPEVAMPLKAEWLIHFDPRTEIQRDKNRIQASFQGSVADIYSLAPTRCIIQWGFHQVKKSNLEAFTFRETKRVVIQLEWSGNSTTMLTLIHARPVGSNSLQQVSAEVVGQKISAAWSSENRRVSLDWNLANGEVGLK